MGRERGGGLRETFSLFVTLELGAEGKNKPPQWEAIKSKGGGGERANGESETARRARPLPGHCCVSGSGRLPGVTPGATPRRDCARARGRPRLSSPRGSDLGRS